MFHRTDNRWPCAVVLLQFTLWSVLHHAPQPVREESVVLQGQGQGCQSTAHAAEVAQLDLISRTLARVCARRAVPVSTAQAQGRPRRPPVRPAVPVSTAPAQDPLRALHAALGSMAAVPQGHRHRQCARRAVPVSTAAAQGRPRRPPARHVLPIKCPTLNVQDALFQACSGCSETPDRTATLCVLTPVRAGLAQRGPSSGSRRRLFSETA